MPDNHIVSEEDNSGSDTLSGSGEGLNHSREANFFWDCSNPEIETILSELVTELRSYYLSEGGTPRGFKREINLNILRRLIADLHVCYLSDSTRWLAVPFDREYYSVNTRYQPLFGAQGAAKRVRDFLHSNGYADVVAGFNDPNTGVGFRTRIRATQRLADLLTNISVFDYSMSGESIRLKDDNKQLVEYDDTDLTNRMRGDIEIINNLISRSWIDIRVPDDTFQQISSRRLLELSRNKLMRIFNNGTFEQGGRFYGGWWIEIKARFRPYITIDGAETIELDYSSMHLAILYAQAGLDLPAGDLYEIEGYPRKIVKTVFTRSVNCNSRIGTVNSIVNSIREDIRKANLKIEQARTEHERNLAINKRQSIIEYTFEQLSEVAQRFEELHPLISDYLYLGNGLQLQCLDARIANLTMLRLSELNIVALPVHDSFIVKRVHERQLQEAMFSSFNSILEGSVNVGEGIVSTVETQGNGHFDFATEIGSYSLYNIRRLEAED
tara:strand:+ start:111 stop:1601 length:1491 start_codon:yes stop_codon:yes gene_type:complete